MRSNHPEITAGHPRPGRQRTVSREEKKARRHARRVVATFGVPPGDVDDLVQEVMFAASRSTHLFSVPVGRTEAAARSAWLRKITARRVARYRWRRALDSCVELRPDVPSGDWLGRRTAPSPEVLLLRYALFTILHEGLAQLRRTAPEQHAVLVAHVLEERPMRRIAGDLGLSVPVAWNRLHRAKAALRAHLLGEIRAQDRISLRTGREHGSPDARHGKGRGR